MPREAGGVRELTHGAQSTPSARRARAAQRAARRGTDPPSAVSVAARPRALTRPAGPRTPRRRTRTAPDRRRPPHRRGGCPSPPPTRRRTRRGKPRRSRDRRDRQVPDVGSNDAAADVPRPARPAGGTDVRRQEDVGSVEGGVHERHAPQPRRPGDGRDPWRVMAGTTLSAASQAGRWLPILRGRPMPREGRAGKPEVVVVPSPDVPPARIKDVQDERGVRKDVRVRTRGRHR